MSNSMVQNKSKPTVVRRLRSPYTQTFKQDKPFCFVTDLKVLSENRHPSGIATSEECHELVSPSFIPLLEKDLPFPCLHPSLAAFGGAWFWEGYRHALFGEDVIYNLAGTGNNLIEDTIDSQKQLRKELMSEKRLFSFDLKNQRLGTNRVWLHSSAKLEVIYAIALSVALHVSHQPLLDHGQGPHALVLCASKYECDEITFVLNQFCSDLHLVVHDLFEPFPSMPSSERADIVVGTPPLWDSVAELGRAQDRKGLEDILSKICSGRPPPTYASSKWRPYTIRNVTQLVLFDFNLQVNVGFDCILFQILALPDSSPPPRTLLPLHCQIYSVVDADHSPYTTEINSTLLEILTTRAKHNQEKLTEISIQSTNDPSLHTNKRVRLDESVLPLPFSATRNLTAGLLIKNAVSFPRLLLDKNVVEDFVTGVLDKAALFCKSFDEPQADKADKSDRTLINSEPIAHCYVKCELVYVCISYPGGALKVQDLCLLLLPQDESNNESHFVVTKSSRCSLLFRHLEEQLNGELFDGNVLSCVNLQDSLFRNYHYQLLPLEDQFLDTASLYQDYLSVLGMGQFLLATHVNDKDDAYVKESSSVDLLRSNACSLSDSDNASKFQISNTMSELVLSIPSHAFLTQVSIRHTFTVVALRNVAKSVTDLCYRRSSFSDEQTLEQKKPLVLFLLEECCQYGRVVSYYCYQDEVSDAVNGSRIDSNCKKTMKESGNDFIHESLNPNEREIKTSRLNQALAASTTATLFIEFESHESALETVRLLRGRFESGISLDKSNPDLLYSHVHLFRNATYYAGVEQDLTRKKEKSHVSLDEHSNDDILDFSLLAE